MENSQPLLTKENLIAFSADYNFCNHERDTFNQLLSAIENNDLAQLDWFSQFGNRIRAILLNSYAYTKGLQFGFTKIEFDQFGWFKGPVFLDQEELNFGLPNASRYSDYSTITLGKGINSNWTYGLQVSFGAAGSRHYGISVYGVVCASKQEALSHALNELKSMMQTKVADHDPCNNNQKVISATLMSIEKFQFSKVQLSLF
jgi:hypothetical protein